MRQRNLPAPASGICHSERSGRIGLIRSAPAGRPGTQRPVPRDKKELPGRRIVELARSVEGSASVFRVSLPGNANLLIGVVRFLRVPHPRFVRVGLSLRCKRSAGFFRVLCVPVICTGKPGTAPRCHPERGPLLADEGSAVVFRVPHPRFVRVGLSLRCKRSAGFFSPASSDVVEAPDFSPGAQRLMLRKRERGVLRRAKRTPPPSPLAQQLPHRLLMLRRLLALVRNRPLGRRQPDPQPRAPPRFFGNFQPRLFSSRHPAPQHTANPFAAKPLQPKITLQYYLCFRLPYLQVRGPRL